MFGGDLKEVSWKNGKMPPVGSVLYTSPQPSKPWVGLTDEERVDIAYEYESSIAAALMVEAKLREKNA